MLHEDRLGILNTIGAGHIVLVEDDLSHLHEVVVFVRELKEVEVKLLVFGLQGHEDLVFACIVEMVVIVFGLLDLFLLAVVEEAVDAGAPLRDVNAKDRLGLGGGASHWGHLSHLDALGRCHDYAARCIC